MRKLMRNCRGAVTVFVTLLLIPAILISGTAVDVARLYTARSIVQDANQLAANALLASYDALLQDIYGLYGVQAASPALAGMIEEYVETAIFGEDWYDKGPGSLQLFYGTRQTAAVEVVPAVDQNLRSAELLRRQIEEYMRLRGPLVLESGFLEALESSTLKEDVEIIRLKLAIDACVARLADAYKALNSALSAADKCKSAIGMGYFKNVSSRLKDIQSRFGELRDCRAAWENASAADKWQYEEHYQAILECIIAYSGGSADTGYGSGSNWQYGAKSGWASKNNNVVGLNKTVENALNDAEKFKSKFVDVLSLAQEIDELQEAIARQTSELEDTLSGSLCDVALQAALQEKTGVDKRTQIERYRALAQEDITPLALSYQLEGERYIDDIVIPNFEDIKYREAANSAKEFLTREQLVDIKDDPRFDIRSSANEASYFAAFADVSYQMPDGFVSFANISAEHGAFFQTLSGLFKQPRLVKISVLYEGQEEAVGKDAEEQQRNIIASLLRSADEAYNCLLNDPQGALHLNSAAIWGPQTPALLDIADILDTLGEASCDNVIDVLADPWEQLAHSGDYLLLLSYGAAMFSNFTTAKPGGSGGKPASTISGVPLSPAVNYFYQAEWEYLYSGYASAGENLNAVTRLLLSARLVSNYISVFSVDSLSELAINIQEAFAWNLPLALTLGELARASFVAAESVADVAALRAGYKTPLLKSEPHWSCGPSGLLRELEEIPLRGAAGSLSGYEAGLSYAHYLLFFFLSKAAVWPGLAGATAELAARSGDLIEWNMINYTENIWANEEQMAAALASAGSYKLAERHTDFSISSALELRMLFLSMPFAQKGLRGVVPPRTLPVTATDYRGY